MNVAVVYKLLFVSMVSSARLLHNTPHEQTAGQSVDHVAVVVRRVMQ